MTSDLHRLAGLLGLKGIELPPDVSPEELVRFAELKVGAFTS